ncbi:hypothetical protein [Taibaiella soli]|uniref:Uncharacterized protein n=1 Tax=Taibaiella soli TaxID=1649169 RepID=A0A2W2B8K5_9BACT|nr:hypothetical protein [Taibaiella soli]PZF72619.1 hypothetical protein DN068_12190 [Taibaiella soli]
MRDFCIYNDPLGNNRVDFQDIIYYTMKNYLNLLFGASIGLSLGLILGLSISPVAQAFLGVFSSIIAVILGVQKPIALSTESASSSLGSVAKTYTVIGFGFALSIGIILGILLRTHEVLEVSLDKRVNNWVRAGYSQKDALEYAAFEKLGFRPDHGQQWDTSKKANLFGSDARAGVLFDDQVKTALCNFTTLQSNVSDEVFVGNLRSVYQNYPMPKLNALSDSIQSLHLPVAIEKKLLIALNRFICTGD